MDLARSFTREASTTWTVDTHQHVFPETPIDTDICRLLLDDNYISTDFVSAGLTNDDRQRIADPTAPLRRRWALLSPYWELVRHGSYAQAILITLRDLYGAKTLQSTEIEKVSARITADFAKPGMFQRIFHDRCGIDVVLTQGGSASDFKASSKPRIKHVARFLVDWTDFSPSGPFHTAARQLGIEVKSVADLAPAMDAIIRDHHARGSIGLKMAALAWRQPTEEELRNAFEQWTHPSGSNGLTSQKLEHSLFPLRCLFIARAAALAEELDIPIAIHTGAPWTNWLDFRAWEPTMLIPLLSTFRGTHFDLYHAGLPYGPQASMLGKAFPNVWHNLAWAHIISCELATRAMNEWLDLIPTNKIMAFGGDYNNRTVAFTYGHLMLARRNVSQVFANRVHSHQMTEKDARTVLRAWFSSNPRQLYRI
jgi:predicted TIM-barrel fold metal-dependent hydrolase